MTNAAFAPPLLVVDDNQATRHALASLLRVHGYQVNETPDGDLALQEISASQTRLVVLIDFWMPNMDAIALLQAIASNTELATRHAYVLLISSTPDTTGHKPPIDFTALQARLHASLLTRPVGIDELVRVVYEAQQRLSAQG